MPLLGGVGGSRVECTDYCRGHSGFFTACRGVLLACGGSELPLDNPIEIKVTKLTFASRTVSFPGNDTTATHVSAIALLFFSWHGAWSKTQGDD
jgi:hypothetical protein